VQQLPFMVDENRIDQFKRAKSKALNYIIRNGELQIFTATGEFVTSCTSASADFFDQVAKELRALGNGAR